MKNIVLRMARLLIFDLRLLQRAQPLSLWTQLDDGDGRTLAAPETDPLAGYVDLPRWMLHRPTADRLAPRTRRFSLN